MKKDQVVSKKDGVTEKSEKKQKKLDLKVEDKVSQPKEKAKEFKPVKAAEDEKAKGGKKVIKKGDETIAKSPKESENAKKQGEMAIKDKTRLGKALGEDSTGKTRSFKKEEKAGKKVEKVGKKDDKSGKKEDKPGKKEEKKDEKTGKKEEKLKQKAVVEGKIGKQKEGEVDELGKKDKMYEEKIKKLLEVPKSGRQKEGAKTDTSLTRVLTKITKPKEMSGTTKDDKAGKPKVEKGTEPKDKRGSVMVVKNTLQKLANDNLKMQLEKAKMAPRKVSRSKPPPPRPLYSDRLYKPYTGQSRFNQQMPAKGGTTQAPTKPIKTPVVLKKAEGEKRYSVDNKKEEETKKEHTSGIIDIVRNKLDDRQTIVGKQAEEEAQKIKIYLSKHTDELFIAEDKSVSDATKLPGLDSKDYAATAAAADDKEPKYSLHSLGTKHSLVKVSDSKLSAPSGSRSTHSTKASNSKTSTTVSGTKQSRESKLISNKYSQDSKQVSLASIKDSVKSRQKLDSKHLGSQSHHSSAGVGVKHSNFSEASEGHKQKEEEVKSAEEQLDEIKTNKEVSDGGKEIENKVFENTEPEDEEQNKDVGAEDSVDEEEHKEIDSGAKDDVVDSSDNKTEADEDESGAPRAEQDNNSDDDKDSPDEDGDDDSDAADDDDDVDQNQKDEDDNGGSGNDDESDGGVEDDENSGEEDNQSGNNNEDQEEGEESGDPEDDDNNQDDNENKNGAGAGDGTDFFGDD